MKFNSGMEREQQEMNIFGFGFGCVFDGQFIGYGVHELFIQTLIHTVGDSKPWLLGQRQIQGEVDVFYDHWFIRGLGGICLSGYKIMGHAKCIANGIGTYRPGFG